jgi:L-lactate dehydrogenase (cytochrome)
MPVALAPTGLMGFLCGDGEILAARAAAAAGIPFCLSTMSICSIEDVASATKRPFWFQLYVFKDRGFSEALMARAHASGCNALFVTVDLPVWGQRHADIKNGLVAPPRLTLRGAFDIAIRPGWALGVLAAKRRTFGNIDAYLAATGIAGSPATWSQQQFDHTLNWRDVEWIRKLWPGPLVLGTARPRQCRRRC